MYRGWEKTNAVHRNSFFREPAGLDGRDPNKTHFMPSCPNDDRSLLFQGTFFAPPSRCLRSFRTTWRKFGLILATREQHVAAEVDKFLKEGKPQKTLD